MKLLFTVGLILLLAGLANNTVGYVGLIVLTLASGWALVDLAGKV